MGAEVTTTEQALNELKAHFGASWQIWYVPHALDGGMTWCAPVGSGATVAAGVAPPGT